MAHCGFLWKLAFAASCLLSGQTLLSQATATIGIESPLAYVQQGTKDSAQIDVVRSCGPSVVTIRTDSGIGSGFIVLDGRHVATCYHVIEGATKITVETSKGTKFSVESVFIQPVRDVAILLLSEDTHLKPIQLGDKEVLQAGQTVVVIGTSLGVLAQSITAGTYSRKWIDRSGTTVIQFSAPISPGNSGGPVLTLNKKVIGLAQVSLTAGQNVNMGVDISYVRAGLAGSYHPLSTLIHANNSSSEVTPTKAKPAITHAATKMMVVYCDFVNEIIRANLMFEKETDKLWSKASPDALPNLSENTAVFNRFYARIDRALDVLKKSWPKDSATYFPFEMSQRVRTIHDSFDRLLKIVPDAVEALRSGHSGSFDDKGAGEAFERGTSTIFDIEWEQEPHWTWFDYSSFNELVTPLHYIAALGAYGVEADPAYEWSCVCFSEDQRVGIPVGSTIVAIREVGSESFTKVRTWKDIDHFTVYPAEEEYVVKLKTGAERLIKRKIKSKIEESSPILRSQ